MTANKLDLDATIREMDAIQATWQEIQNTPAPGLVTARLICAEQSAADVPDLIAKVKQLVAEVRRFKPVRFKSGEQLYVHRCNNVEWWHEPTLGPINDQGCDGCEAGPDGGWRPVHFHESGDGR